MHVKFAVRSFVLELLAFNVPKFRVHVTLATSSFQNILRGPVCVHGNMYVKFEVRSFNCFEDISIISLLHTAIQPHTHQSKTFSLPLTPFIWQR